MSPLQNSIHQFQKCDTVVRRPVQKNFESNSYSDNHASLMVEKATEFDVHLTNLRLVLIVKIILQFQPQESVNGIEQQEHRT